MYVKNKKLIINHILEVHFKNPMLKYKSWRLKYKNKNYK